jgi:hypothetical protein
VCALDRLQKVGIIAIFVVAVAALVSAEVNHAYPSTVETNQVTSQQTSSLNPSSELGLNLTLNIEPTLVQQGDYVSISASVTNILGTTNVLSAPPTWLGGGGGCLVNSYSVYQGNYDASNLTNAIELDLSPAVQTGIPQYPAVPETYAFAPRSDLMTLVYPSSAPAYLQNSNASATCIGQISGYWISTPPPPTNRTFVLFPTGIYTIVADDAWGQQAIMSFQVVQNTTA